MYNQKILHLNILKVSFIRHRYDHNRESSTQRSYSVRTTTALMLITRSSGWLPTKGKGKDNVDFLEGAPAGGRTGRTCVQEICTKVYFFH